MSPKFIFNYFLLITLSAFNTVAQEDAIKKVLLTLQEGESIVTNESCLNFSGHNEQLYLVTWQDKQFYVYENGTRKGPYKKPEDIKFRECENAQIHECAVFNYPEENNIESFVELTDDGRYIIKFRGEKYGPYNYVYHLHVSPDKALFAAIVANAEMKFSLITSNGLEQNLTGTFERFIASPSGKQFLVLIKEGIDISALPGISEADMIAYMQEQTQKQEDAGGSVTQIIGTEGNLYGKYISSVISSNNPAYCRTGDNNWYMIINNALFVNGNMLKQFSKNINASTCNIWLSPDGKRYALIDYNIILFSDGKTYPAPIKLEVEQSGTKTVLKWIALENETELVSYSKEL